MLWLQRSLHAGWPRQKIAWPFVVPGFAAVREDTVLGLMVPSGVPYSTLAIGDKATIGRRELGLSICRIGHLVRPLGPYRYLGTFRVRPEDFSRSVWRPYASGSQALPDQNSGTGVQLLFRTAPAYTHANLSWPLIC